MQTGIYPIETPGGWQLIGRTPIALFDPVRENPSLLNAGARVRFIPIGLEEYEQIKHQDGH
jgi:inhibitor of KinA